MGKLSKANQGLTDSQAEKERVEGVKQNIEGYVRTSDGYVKPTDKGSKRFNSLGVRLYRTAEKQYDDVATEIDATAEKVAALGGEVCCGPQDVGTEGRFAAIVDPTGAHINIFKGGDGMNPWGHGSFCWNELLTTDMHAADAFYTSLFGWTSEASHTSEEPYSVFKNGEDWAGGMMNMHWEGTPAWLCYVSVADVDLTTSKAVELGATVCFEPADIPGIGRFSVFTDPVGSTIALFTGLSESCDCDCNCS